MILVSPRNQSLGQNHLLKRLEETGSALLSAWNWTPADSLSWEQHCANTECRGGLFSVSNVEAALTE